MNSMHAKERAEMPRSLVPRRNGSSDQLGNTSCFDPKMGAGCGEQCLRGTTMRPARARSI